jgi:hypothetical protein
MRAAAIANHLRVVLTQFGQFFRSERSASSGSAKAPSSDLTRIMTRGPIRGQRRALQSRGAYALGASGGNSSNKNKILSLAGVKTGGGEPLTCQRVEKSS